MTRRFGSAIAASVVAVLLLAGCGSGSSVTAGGPTSGPPSADNLTATQLHVIRQCLKAAGIHHTFSSPAPGGGLNGTPIAKPTGGPISGGPGTALSYGGIFNQQRVVKALHLCQISLPGVAPSS